MRWRKPQSIRGNFCVDFGLQTLNQFTVCNWFVFSCQLHEHSACSLMCSQRLTGQASIYPNAIHRFPQFCSDLSICHVQSAKSLHIFWVV